MKIENHVAANALHLMYYNFVRIHQTLRITPAMAAGVTDRVWEVSDIMKLVDDYPELRIREGQEASRKATERSYNPSGPVLRQ